MIGTPDSFGMSPGDEIHMGSPDLVQKHGTAAETQLMFCVGCGKAPGSASVATACPYCGDRLVRQGFCPVCEQHLRQPVGSACPKHDLPLEASAPRRSPTAE